jgi:hypothetical protein
MLGQGHHAGHRVMTTTEQWQNEVWQGRAELGQKRAKCNFTQHESPKNTISPVQSLALNSRWRRSVRCDATLHYL